MKEVIFTSDAPPDSEELKKMLFGDESDPRSMNYVRVLKRPELPWGRILLSLIGSGLFLTGIAWGIFSLRIPTWLQWVSTITAICLYLLIHLKSISICGVRIYQRFAPDSIRNKCRFEPSCSEYMILSIQKYGVIHGIRKGINRLKRCNIHNGGYDAP